MSPPTVSVIIPTYNRAALLPRAWDSVLAQTFTDWEIVLVDDGSTDATPQLAASYAERLGERFIYLPQENRGCCTARNRGIDACSGRFVAFLDSDDEFAPTKLERQLSLFALRPELGFVYSDFAFIDLDGVHHPSVFDAKFPLARRVVGECVAPGLYVVGHGLFDSLVRGYFIATIVGMVRREVLGGSIRFRTDQPYAEEWFFYLKVARATAAGFVDEPLSIHHYVPQSITRSDKRRNTFGYYRLLKDIDATFGGLTTEQRRIVRANLAQACRQVGCEAAKDGRNADAVRQLAEAFRYRPQWATLRELTRSSLACLVTPGRGRPSVPQLLPGAVR